MGCPYGEPRGRELAVEIADVDGVEVNERDVAHARAGKRLGAPAAHAPAAKHYDARPAQALHAFGAVEKFRAVHLTITRRASAPFDTM